MTDRTHSPSQDHPGTARGLCSPITDAEIGEVVADLRAPFTPWSPTKAAKLMEQAADLLTRLSEDKARMAELEGWAPEARKLLVRAHDRIHSLPRTTDTELACKIGLFLGGLQSSARALTPKEP